jgi:hypothetical protein
MGRRWQEASEQAKRQALERWEVLRGGWKADPGIRYIGNFDKDGHHILFEIDDVTKEAEMASAFYQANFPIDRFSFELASGSTEQDEYWTS